MTDQTATDDRPSLKRCDQCGRTGTRLFDTLTASRRSPSARRRPHAASAGPSPPGTTPDPQAITNARATHPNTPTHQPPRTSQGDPVTSQPLTDQQLDEIEGRAAGLYEYATGLDDAWQDEADRLSGTDVPALVAEVRRLQARVTELEGPAVHALAALAALCYDLEDPGSNALGALYLLRQATVAVDAPKDDAALALARREAQVMRRCAEFVRDTYSGEWADDAAATLERDADVTERGCPGFEKEYQGVSDAKRRLANCKHCGKPWAAHPAA